MQFSAIKARIRRNAPNAPCGTSSAAVRIYDVESFQDTLGGDELQIEESRVIEDGVSCRIGRESIINAESGLVGG